MNKNTAELVKKGYKRGSENVIAKGIKLDMAEGVAQWEEGPQEQEDNRSTFLYEPPTQKRGVGENETTTP